MAWEAQCQTEPSFASRAAFSASRNGGAQGIEVAVVLPGGGVRGSDGVDNQLGSVTVPMNPEH
jgi:hypothetical protein